MTVFLDTVGMLALWDESDQWHSLAVEAYSKIVGQRASFLTTTYVLLELGNAAARRPYRNEVDELRRALEMRAELIAPNAEDWPSAWSAFRRGEAANAGIVDQFSFAVMRRLGIDDEFTNDRHFAAAGFTMLF
ncbi:MAG: PIN domain-containing protein [Pirellulales bacterium]